MVAGLETLAITASTARGVHLGVTFFALRNGNHRLEGQTYSFGH
jgi:hypothetical protein